MTVGAQRYEDLAWAAAYGYEPEKLENLSCELGGFDLIVNTIPAMVLDWRRLGWVNPDAFLLDLASAPGGVDQAAAKELGLRVLQAPGLPGRTARSPPPRPFGTRCITFYGNWRREDHG